ncbi:F-box protein At3g12350 [Rhodamnia argentea]|uniref:F-box protein n=1 Tax=Rhodamnia argentea TaxID=178133 RepID=A0A8B8PUB7_9MYRT|nr:F-box protein At3g12350 [Rhodamnia argentea]
MEPDFIPTSFADFPEDVHLCILSFLTPSEIANFSCTSKRFVSLCRSNAKLWYALCDRRWGSKTQIRKWGNGKIGYRLLYKTLSEWESLIGFWRRSGQRSTSSSAVATAAVVPPPPLVSFEWGPSFVAGSRVSPSEDGTYGVVKSPFLWMSLSSSGEPVNFVDPDGKSGEFGSNYCDDSIRKTDLIPVDVNFMGCTYLVVEENMGLGCSSHRNGFRRSLSSANLCSDEEEASGSENGTFGSLPDRYMSEMYQNFANRTSPSRSGAARRQRKREKARQGKRKWEAEHFVKIIDCSPTPSRPLQGLWKGIGDCMKLEFYLVTYDEIGGIACRRVGEPADRFSGCAPVFWTSKAKFIEPPFSLEEAIMYDSRVHLHPTDEENFMFGEPPMENEPVSRILYINSSYDLLIPDLAGTTATDRRNEGRIWQYRNGTFGFGFLWDNFIIDLKHIALNGCLLR